MWRRVPHPELGGEAEEVGRAQASFVDWDSGKFHRQPPCCAGGRSSLVYTVTGTPAPAHLGSWPEFQNVCPERSGFLSPVPPLRSHPALPCPLPGCPPSSLPFFRVTLLSPAQAPSALLGRGWVHTVTPFACIFGVSGQSWRLAGEADRRGGGCSHVGVAERPGRSKCQAAILTLGGSVSPGLRESGTRGPSRGGAVSAALGERVPRAQHPGERDGGEGRAADAAAPGAVARRQGGASTAGREAGQPSAPGHSAPWRAPWLLLRRIHPSPVSVGSAERTPRWGEGQGVLQSSTAVLGESPVPRPGAKAERGLVEPGGAR